MSHWASDKYDEFREVISGTEWSFSPPERDRAPLEFNHSDGSEVGFVNATSRTGTYSVEYIASENASEAVTDKRTSWGDLENAVEWVIHVLERHEEKN